MFGDSSDQEESKGFGIEKIRKNSKRIEKIQKESESIGKEAAEFTAFRSDLKLRIPHHDNMQKASSLASS